MQSILILGFGISGQAAAKLASKLKMKIHLADERDSATLRENARKILSPDATLSLGWKEGEALPKTDWTVASPGLSESASPLLRAALKRGVPVMSELEFGFRHMRCPIVAITGTNGKTTTTELTTCLFNACGLKAAAAGNIGEGLSEVAAENSEKFDLVVVETSSFQLERASSFKPVAAAVLNIASDHINRHGSLEEYAKVKFALFSTMQPDPRTMIVNGNLLPQWGKFLPKGLAPTSFSSREKADFSFDGQSLLFQGKALVAADSLALKGLHNIENALASLALLRAVAGDHALSDAKVMAALKSFRAGDHRIDVFAKKEGIQYIDDSKGTNPHAVLAAVAALPEPGKVCILLGGLDKGMDFSPLREIGPRVRKAFLLGECRDKMARALMDAFEMEVCGSFEEAVEKACDVARKGDYVLLSPACASMDMFKDYKERGDTFKRLCLERIKV